MKYIIGNPRNQAPLLPLSLEEQIGRDNEVRVIDLFVDSLPLSEFGFKVDQGENGRPASAEKLLQRASKGHFGSF